jgi:hypothetical protein
MKVGDLVRLKDRWPFALGIVIDINKQVEKRHSPLAGDIVVYWPDVEMKTVEFWDCLRLVK